MADKRFPLNIEIKLQKSKAIAKPVVLPIYQQIEINIDIKMDSSSQFKDDEDYFAVQGCIDDILTRVNEIGNHEN